VPDALLPPAWLWRLVFLLPIIVLVGSSEPGRILPHDAYIWQRQWTPAVAAAVEQSADLIGAWRVLAARSDEHGRLRPVAIDWQVLERSARPVVVVVRIEGQLAQWDEAQLLADVRAVLDEERRDVAPVAGIEIDYDCGTARLLAYAHFLTKLRAGLVNGMRLSITALPAWLLSRDLDAVVASADEIVLQVHAVRDPRAGLFDAGLGLQWAKSFARRTTKPFRVALPNYGSRMIWREDGSLLAVESETPRLTGGASAAELTVTPTEVAALLRGLERDPPATLAGIVWFRLPTAEDKRAWSLDTWRAVISGEDLEAHIETVVRESATPGMRDIVLLNRGAVDAETPPAITLPRACTIADGVNGYVIAHAASGLVLERRQVGLLRSRHQQIIGWMRCTEDRVASHEKL
jgi:hypothetical protein